MLTAEEATNFIMENKNVAIVGLSPKEDRPSYRVGKFLQENDFKITPVNPVYREILGETSLKSLSFLEKNQVDWIDLFVNPQKLMEFVDEIIRLSPKLVWCQLGVVNDHFNKKLEEAGIPYIADRCPKIELEKRQ